MRTTLCIENSAVTRLADQRALIIRDLALSSRPPHDDPAHRWGLGGGRNLVTRITVSELHGRAGSVPPWASASRQTWRRDLPLKYLRLSAEWGDYFTQVATISCRAALFDAQPEGMHRAEPESSRYPAQRKSVVPEINAITLRCSDGLVHGKPGLARDSCVGGCDGRAAGGDTRR